MLGSVTEVSFHVGNLQLPRLGHEGLNLLKLQVDAFFESPETLTVAVSTATVATGVAMIVATM